MCVSLWGGAPAPRRRVPAPPAASKADPPVFERAGGPRRTAAEQELRPTLPPNHLHQPSNLDPLPRRPFLETHMLYTRRDIGKIALAAGTASRLLAAKPNSVFGGVQIGTITYSFRALPSSAEQVLQYCLDCGI